MLTSSLFLLSMIPDAAACGGFFCNNIEPIRQAGEHVIFEVDREANQTTMHVQVAYEGPPSEFAWIVPVAGEPDLFVSNDALFRVVDQWTKPQFAMYSDYIGECGWDIDDDGGFNGIPNEPSVLGGDGVTVLDQSQVGPYDTVTLSAESEQALVQWLQANGYAIPDLLESALAPYVSDRHNFVALRLSSGSDTGDLTPLGMRYQGTQPSIPIQLTSIAAADDMQLITTILGDHRAVPTNYLHVEVNYAAIDWFSWGANYLDVLSRAADEAGGHAFATEYSGSTESFRGLFYREEWDDLHLEQSTGPMDFVQRVTSSGVTPSQALLDVLMDTVPVPTGYDAQGVYNCPSCFPELDSQIPFDATLAASEMNSKIFDPLAEIDGMFQRSSVLTRLGSTVSPDEMTVDPVFGFNELMANEVSNYHEARLEHYCNDESTFNYNTLALPRKLVLPNGTVIHMPSSQWISDHGTTDPEYLASLQEPAAIVIEQTSATAYPTLIFDGTDLVDQIIDEHNADTDALEARGGCACDATSSGAGAIWLLGLAPLFLRRRA